MEFQKIKYSQSNGIASIKLNSPKNLNALDEPILDDLMVALDMCAEDEAVKVVVISGEGKSFSAGGDIGMMLKGLESGEQKLGASVRKVGIAALKIRNLRKPVIASVHGPVAGAGFNFALLCDFRIAAENSKFIQAFVNIGLVPDMGGTFLLTRMLGAARATELIMTGRPVSAEEALSLGLVNQVVPLENLEETTLKFAQKLSNLPSIALGKMKALVNRAAFFGFENDLDNETEYQIQCTNTEDFKEGIRAFTEKRKPNFQGK
ncbi:enoyl-CoA hydratase-related protein [Clostridium sediminicola]|uniref:enoyl-CoA hydratase/isomerase family protein n=1 Tax=Clostridium sediminicola TaxID=3114879 RepID=UPI0031F25A82